LVGGDYIIYNSSRYDLQQTPVQVSVQQAPTYQLLNFTFLFENTTSLSIKYFHYNTTTSLQLGGHTLQVTPDLLRVEYTVNNWSFQGSDSYLSIHTAIHGPKIGGLSTGGPDNSGWYINGSAIEVRARTVSYLSGKTMQEIPRWMVPTGQKYNTNSVNNTSFSMHTGTGLPGNNPHVATDLFYSLTVHTTAVLVYQFRSYLGVAVMTLLALGAGFYTLRHIHPRRSPSPPESQIIPDLFGSRPVLYYYLLGTAHFRDDALEDRIAQAIPHELYSFKFLFNPVRLSMVKLLYENLQLTTVELKDLLQLNWNTFNSHLAALKDKGYVEGAYTFQDGTRSQMITLLPYGEEQYQMLTELLHLFLDSTADLELDETDLDHTAQDDLYPGT